ncbi:MAG: hypothetical protein ACI4LA_06475 [Emergencia sp.]
MNRSAKNLRKLNNALDELVTEENQKAYTDIVCYLRGSMLSEYDQELVRRDLLEMILSAQERGDSLQAVIGGDYKAFCDEVIASIPPRSKTQKTVEILDTVCLCLSILFSICLIISKDMAFLLRDAFTGQPLDFTISVSFGALISMAAILAAAWFIVQYIARNAFEESASSRKARMIRGALFGAAACAVVFLAAWLGSRTAFSVNLFAGLAFAAALFLAHLGLERVAVE